MVVLGNILLGSVRIPAALGPVVLAVELVQAVAPVGSFVVVLPWWAGYCLAETLGTFF